MSEAFRKRSHVRLRAIGLLAFLLFATFCLRAQIGNAGMRMHVINIGQGDAILLEFKHQAVLIDTGAEDTLDPGRYQRFLRKYLTDFFQRRGDLNNTLHGVVISHPHPDHTKNLIRVLENFDVETFIEGGGRTNQTKTALNKAKTWMREHGRQRIVVTNRKLKDEKLLAWTNGILVSSDAAVRFLSGRRYCSNENNDSLVMRVEYKQKSFLLVGDAEMEDEAPSNCGGLIRYLHKRYKNTGELDVDVFKVAHHGSYNGISDFMLEDLTPDYAVISAGKFDDQKPGGFHAFQFAHPRGRNNGGNRDALLKIIDATQESRPAFQAYYLDKIKVNGQSVTKRTDFTLTRAVYCTCWDDNVIFSVNTAGNDISVTTKPSP